MAELRSPFDQGEPTKHIPTTCPIRAARSSASSSAPVARRGCDDADDDEMIVVTEYEPNPAFVAVGPQAGRRHRGDQRRAGAGVRELRRGICRRAGGRRRRGLRPRRRQGRDPRLPRRREQRLWDRKCKRFSRNSEKSAAPPSFRTLVRRATMAQICVTCVPRISGFAAKIVSFAVEISGFRVGRTGQVDSLAKNRATATA